MPRATTPISEIGAPDAPLDVQTSGLVSDSSSTGGDSDVPSRSIGDTKVPYDILHYIPEESAQHYRLAPLSVVDGVLEVGMVDPNDIQGFDALNFIARSTGLPFKGYRWKISNASSTCIMGWEAMLNAQLLISRQSKKRDERSPLPHRWISMIRL